MSKHSIVLTEPEKKWTTSYEKCDLCGNKSDPRNGWLGHGPGATSRAFDRTDTKVECRIGDVYPEEDSEDNNQAMWVLDVCPTCFVEKFVPTVEAALNVKFRRE